MERKVNITCRYYLVKKYTDTDNEKEALFDLRKWIAEVKEAFPDFEVDAHPLSLSVACHIGPGALAIACEKKSAIS